MRILLLGNTGQLGWELERTLAPIGELTTCDYPDLDLANPESFLQIFNECQPHLVVNATAYTAVDRAESQPELAEAVNAVAPRVMAEAARDHQAAFIHYSTDYIFDGHKGTPYLESDLPAPLNVYGRTKLAGEQAVSQVGAAYLILRTSWVYSHRRDSFVNKVLGWARNQNTLKLVTDQISGPTWARMLAEISSQLVGMAMNDPYGWISEHHGLYHLAGSGHCSRFEWAQQILQLDPHKQEQVAHELVPALTAEFPTPAIRPLFSALNCDLFFNTFHLQLPNWQFALKLAMEAG